MNLAALFTAQVIKPVLNQLDKASGWKGRLNTQAAINLILMIVAHESGLLTYARQVRGPAMGFTQMEPATFNYLVQWLEKSRPELLDALEQFGPSVPQPEYMIISPHYAVACARLNLIRFPEKFPAADDLQGLAEYAKKYWNTSAGKATAQDYLDAYLAIKGE